MVAAAGGLREGRRGGVRREAGAACRDSWEVGARKQLRCRRFQLWEWKTVTLLTEGPRGKAGWESRADAGQVCGKLPARSVHLCAGFCPGRWGGQGSEAEFSSRRRVLCFIGDACQVQKRGGATPSPDPAEPRCPLVCCFGDADVIRHKY